MGRLLFIVLLFSTFMIAGCGTTETNSNNADLGSGAEGGGTDITLSTSIKAEQETDIIVFDLSLSNLSDEAIELPFSSGQKFEIYVKNDEGQEVYRYSEGMMFTLALETIKVEAGGKLEWQEEWDINQSDASIEDGQYTVHAEIIVQLDESETLKNIDTDMLASTQTFSIEHTDSASEQKKEEAKKPRPNTDSSPNQEENDSETFGNDAFRDVKARGQNGQYQVTGEARMFEATVSYAVSDGHIYFVEDFVTASAGGPNWGSFSIDITLDQSTIPTHGTITLELFEESAQNGSRQHELFVPLEILPN